MKMLYFLFGKLILKKTQFAIIEVSGFGLKILISKKTFKKLPKIGTKIKFFCLLTIKRDGADIYGFLNEKELEIFELLNSVSGIGPKSALEIISAFNIEKFLGAISNARIDLLEKLLGIGRKKAERLILELKDKIKKTESNADAISVLIPEFSNDLKSALKNLGYKQKEIAMALGNIPLNIKNLEDGIKYAIKFLSKT